MGKMVRTIKVMVNKAKIEAAESIYSLMIQSFRGLTHPGKSVCSLGSVFLLPGPGK